MLLLANLNVTYDSDANDILREFYIPALTFSKNYWRMTAYFSVSSFFVACKGFTKLLENDGSVRLILGRELSEDDFNAISIGYKAKETADTLITDLENALKEVENDLLHKRMDALSKLIELDRVEIKIAYRKAGIFHDKVGIFWDENDDGVSFIGSANESSAALLKTRNSESLTVYKSWEKTQSEYFQFCVNRFKYLWNGESSGTIIYTFEEAERKNIVNIIKMNCKKLDDFTEEELEDSLIQNAKMLGPVVPKKLGNKDFSLKDHQRSSLNAWRIKPHNGKGILALATGSGKTITAIYAAVQLSYKINPLFIIIGVPYQNLAEQWCEVLATFNFFPILAYKSKSYWLSPMNQLVQDLNLGTNKLGVCVVVNNTLKSSDFQSILNMVSPLVKIFFIGDECHHYSSKKLNAALPLNADLRLGLSATPFHYIDNDANQRLQEYFGHVVQEYSLKSALTDDVLSPYEYHIIPVKLTEWEAEEYFQLSHKISMRFSSSKSSDDEFLGNLLRKRSRLLSSASNKLFELKILLSQIEPSQFSLFYCGDGNVEFPDLAKDITINSDSVRQVEAVTAILAEKNWHPSRFTSQESVNERKLILENFSSGNIKSLVAIRCLDEGIDIPACEKAFFLASSSNPRQFIQRRGRILRKSPGKEKSVIYDFFVYIPKSNFSSEFDEKLLRRELERVIEFSDSSINRVECYIKLKPILIDYGLEGYF